MNLSRIAAFASVAAFGSLPARSLRADVVHTIAIGYNGVPPGVEGLVPLRYADDDAAAVHEFSRHVSDAAHLLAVLDRDTQRRFPEAARQARKPAFAELTRVVTNVRARIESDRKAGKASTVLFFYSGHGTGGGDGSAGLSLLDRTLTQQMLYDEVLARLPADIIHVLVDACHAEAVVRPRDLQAQRVDVGPAEIASYLQQKTLERFPNVGVVVATTSTAQAHEWDAYQGGIFTHQVLSGMRGAADVDGDGRIEYSEIGAFLAAANRAVTDPRARLTTIVRPPQNRPRAALTEPRRAVWSGRLVGRPAFLGGFFVEDARGNRLVDLRSELGARVELVLPAGQPLFVRGARGEAEVQLGAGERRSLATLPIRGSSMRARGAIESSLRRGLFATQFGPSYYRGFVDRRDDVDPVSLATEDAAEEEVGFRSRIGSSAPGSVVAAGLAGGLAVGAGVFGALALSARNAYESTMVERTAAQARSRYERYGIAAWGLAAGAAITAGIAWWWHRSAQ